MRSHTRVVVIGGGVVGASCLYQLTQSGVSDCLLIEKNELTSGSTWHAAGHVTTYANNWLGMRAGNYAWRLYKDLGEKADYPISFHHTGSFWPAHTEDRMDLFRHLVGVSKSAGVELGLLTPDEMEAMHPYYSTGKSVIGAIHDPYESDLDPSQLTQALAKGARDAGAEVARFTRVVGIERTAGAEWRILTDQGEVLCEYVVNAAGFYGAQVAAMTGQPIPIVTLQHQYLVTEPIAELATNPMPFPIVRDPEIRFYVRREGVGLLFGSYGHAGRLGFADGLPDDFAHQLFPDSVDEIGEVLEAAIEHLPLLGEAGVQRFVNGPIPYTPDAQPLCGPAAGLPNFFQACGIQVGIIQSAAVGKAIAEWVSEGETEWDLSAWDPGRFGNWATNEYASERVIELYGLQYAIPFPHRILNSGRPVLHTAIYAELKSQGAVFGQIGGWERAFWFDQTSACQVEALSFRDNEPWREAVRRECEAVRDAVGVMDHGGFTKYEVEGAGATRFLEQVFCGTVPKVGRVKLAYMLTPRGMIWSEATIARLDENRYLLCGPTLAERRDFDWLEKHLPGDGSVTLRRGAQRSEALMVMGPKSRELLSGLTTADLSKKTAPWMSVTELEVAGRLATAMRVSYVGELGWELHLASDDLSPVYQDICEAGAGLGLVNFGSYALNAMRLEKGYHGWGLDIGVEYTIYDAGLEHFVNLDKPEFIGRDAVLRQREQPSAWCFAGFVIETGDTDALPGDPIFYEQALAGYVTSGGTGFRVGTKLALGFLERKWAEPDRRFEIEILGARRHAIQSPLPFYDADNERLRS